jgi:inorganic pyrophosphatase
MTVPAEDRAVASAGISTQTIECVVEIPKGSRNKYEYDGVPVADPLWNSFDRLEDLPSPLAAEISHFFVVYKDLDSSRRSSVHGWGDRDAALLEIEQSRRRYRATGSYD